MHKRTVLIVLACACLCAAVLGWLLFGPEIGAPPPSSPKEHAGLFPISRGGLWGFIDRTGKVAIEPQFQYADEFSEGLAAVYMGGNGPDCCYYFGCRIPKGGKFGYIDTTGKLVIAAQFDAARQFCEGRAAVNFGGKWGIADSWSTNPEHTFGGSWGFIDKTGKLVLEAQFKYQVSDFAEGLALVHDGTSLNYVDREGRVVLRNVWTTSIFSEGLARTVMKTAGIAKLGFIDRTGRIVIRPRFDNARDFREGRAAVEIDGKWGFISKSGRLAIRPQFDAEPSYFAEGLAAVRVLDGKTSGWGFIDRRGWWAVRPRLEYAGVFSEGLAAAAERDGKRGFIDRTGQFVIELRSGRVQGDPSKNMIGTFSGGLARVSGGYIDKTGQFVWKPAEAESK